MRWSCPHCGTNLSVSDEKLGSGWSFSRCFKCAGYSLIRKPEVNVIKVHGAPAGERVLPTDTQDQQLLSQQVLQNYARYVQPQSQQHQHQLQPQFQPPPMMQSQPATAGVPAELIQIPEPLPDPAVPRSFQIRLPKIDVRGKALPVAIAGAGIMAVCSGIYFFIQGQALLHRARMASAAATAAAASYQQTSASAPAPVSSTQISPISAPASAPAPIEASARNEAIQAAAIKISDRVHQQAMAPARSKPEEDVEEIDARDLSSVTPTIRSMLVRIPIDQAKIRSGPSTRYPIVGYANPETRYEITNWNERWFKIKVASSAAVVAGKKVEGWIRNDLVQLMGSGR